LPFIIEFFFFSIKAQKAIGFYYLFFVYSVKNYHPYSESIIPSLDNQKKVLKPHIYQSEQYFTILDFLLLKFIITKYKDFKIENKST